MSQSEQSAALQQLYTRIEQIVPDFFRDVSDFQHWIQTTYGRENRFYHSAQHVLDMTDTQSPKIAARYQQLGEAIGEAYGEAASAQELGFLRNVHTLAGLAHDAEYHVDGMPTQRALLGHYLRFGDAAITIKDHLPPRDEYLAAHMVFDIFDVKPGQTIPQHQSNELISALMLAENMQACQCPPDLIAACIASIAATRPFRTQETYQDLQTQLARLYEREPVLRDAFADPIARQRHLDLIAGGATVLCNQDVIGFLGGPGPHELAPGDTPNYESVAASLRIAEELVTENGPATMQHAATPGENFTARDMLGGTFGTVRLYERLLKPGSQLVYHGINLHGPLQEVSFPPQETVRAMNELVRHPDGMSGIGDVITLAMKARVASLSLVHALGVCAGHGQDSLKQMMEGAALDSKQPCFTAKPDLGATELLALETLGNRTHGMTNDINRSPIAMNLLRSLGHEKIDQLYQLAETQFGAAGQGNEPSDCLEFLTKFSDVTDPAILHTVVTALVKARQTQQDYTAGANFERLARTLPSIRTAG